jgi:hypothetical protein
LDKSFSTHINVELQENALVIEKNNHLKLISVSSKFPKNRFNLFSGLQDEDVVRPTHVEMMSDEPINAELQNVEMTNIESENVQTTHDERMDVGPTNVELENVKTTNVEATHFEIINVESTNVESQQPVILFPTIGLLNENVARCELSTIDFFNFYSQLNSHKYMIS